MNPTIEQIKRHTAAQFSIEMSDMRSTDRKYRFSHARQAAMYLSRELTGRSYSEIAKKFGGRDHTTVLHACRAIPERMTGAPKLAMRLAIIQHVIEWERAFLATYQGMGGPAK